MDRTHDVMTGSAQESAPKPDRTRRQRGVAILTVLMSLALLGATTADLAYNAQVEMEAAANSRDMLRACSMYTWDLKQRIMSHTGHLSNEDLSDWLTNDFDGRARHVVLAHLSQRANEPNLARITAEIALQMRPPLFRAETKISISKPKEPTDWFEF